MNNRSRNDFICANSINEFGGGQRFLTFKYALEWEHEVESARVSVGGTWPDLTNLVGGSEGLIHEQSDALSRGPSLAIMGDYLA